MIGPFSTEADTRPVTRPVYDAPDGLKAGNLRLLTETIAAAQVECGPLDDQVVAWLANWEPYTVAVLAGLIDRAYEAGRVHG